MLLVPVLEPSLRKGQVGVLLWRRNTLGLLGRSDTDLGVFDVLSATYNKILRLSTFY